VPVVYPQYGAGLPGNPALDGLRASGSLSPQRDGSRVGLNPNRLTESDWWGPDVSSGGRPGYGGQLSPPPSVTQLPRTSGPYPMTPPVEVSGDQGVLESLRRAFPLRKFEPPSIQKMEQ